MEKVRPNDLAFGAQLDQITKHQKLERDQTRKLPKIIKENTRRRSIDVCLIKTPLKVIDAAEPKPRTKRLPPTESKSIQNTVIHFESKYREDVHQEHYSRLVNDENPYSFTLVPTARETQMAAAEAARKARNKKREAKKDQKNKAKAPKPAKETPKPKKISLAEYKKLKKSTSK